MRVTFVKLLLLFLTSSLAYAHDGHTQEILNRSVTLEINNVSLKTALKTIEKNARVRFSYSRNTINLDEEISISVKDELLYKVLDQMLSRFRIQYKVINDQILLFNSRTSKKQSQVLIQSP
ncbi:MAG TPA: hypothetical protein VM935_10650, partial [Chitinophagaceae bacterium]|nr:hypothetical protein [Chitinophagaceae bacterium]